MSEILFSLKKSCSIFHRLPERHWFRPVVLGVDAWSVSGWLAQVKRDPCDSKAHCCGRVQNIPNHIA